MSPGPHPDDALVLGPLLRHVDETSATVWVRTAAAATVTVERAGRAWSAPTFSVHGSHYALVVLDGLVPGSQDAYTVAVDDVAVWPLQGAPESRIRTLDPRRTTRFAFGTCRTNGSHDEAGNRAHGIDALRSLAVALRDDPATAWPDLLLLLGDQVYADTTPHAELEEFMRSRRSLDEPPGPEIKDYVEYAELYRLAWSDDVIRWVLSTVPSAMMFDDHDIRDDWNTSWSWRRDIRATTWWQERIVSGLAAYWVHQHIGNLSPAELAEEEVWRLVADHAASSAAGELDLTDVLDELATRADAEPESYRWSYTRALGDSTLVVIDSRAARDLRPDSRSMLDAGELDWLDGVLRGGSRHVLIGTSLPFLLPPGLHDFEAMNEAMAQGAYGRRVAHGAEKMRRHIDLEHWAAFNNGFDEVFAMVMEVARGERGAAPETVTFLSGDVHNSYLAEVADPQALGASARVVQAVCSPIRNPMPRGVRVVMSLFARSLVRPMRFIAARSRRVPDPPFRWSVTDGPWFDNNIALCHVATDALELAWVTGVVDGGPDHPRLRTVYATRIEALPSHGGTPTGVDSGSAQGDPRARNTAGVA
ncbi:alkaline phosphatase D family protein [Oryzobacter terrae]|uniref:alkaline phosphatase D family protein n=1 Tax=Oryzobacter terrae TaxID=1620385 RepID=UPI003671C971